MPSKSRGVKCSSFSFVESKKLILDRLVIMEFQSSGSKKDEGVFGSKRFARMRQSYSEIEETTNCFNEIIKERGGAQVQKIVTTPHYICMQARVRGMSLFLYLGRGFDYFGMHLFKEYVPPSIG